MNLVKNKQIKKALQDRWKELDITKMSLVIKDATERSPGIKITNDRMSKWLSDYTFNGKAAGLTETQIVWLCVRYSIPISLNIGEPSLNDGKLTFVIPPHNELEALKKLKIMFPDGKK